LTGGLCLRTQSLADNGERAMRETRFILETTACLATLIMLALAVADWVLKFIAEDTPPSK
jgi:hypothetical protein